MKIQNGTISQFDVPNWKEFSHYFSSPCCPKCNAELPANFTGCDCCIWEGDTSEGLPVYYDDGEYKAECSLLGDITILDSPYYTVNDGCKRYCLGPDWFNDKAPYPLYYVYDDSEVVQ